MTTPQKLITRIALSTVIILKIDRYNVLHILDVVYTPVMLASDS